MLNTHMRSKRLSIARHFLALAIGLSVTPAVWPLADADRDREIQIHLQKAQEALKSGNPSAADREFRAILALDPDNANARGNLAVIHFLQADWSGAAEQFRRVLKVQPNLWKAQALLGICEKHLGRPREAQRLLEQSVPHLDSGSLRTQAGLELLEIQYRAGDLDNAVAIVATLERTTPTNIDVLYAAYRVYADLTNRTRDALVSIAPNSSRMHEIMAQHLINEGDLSGAITQYRKALAIDPTIRGIHYELGEAILTDSTSDIALQQADQEFRAALAENPGDAGAEYWLGKICERRLDYKSAEEHYSRALALSPDHVYAHIGMAVALTHMKDLQGALDHLVAAGRLDPMNLTVHFRLASIYRELGREGDARAELTTFKKLRESKKQIKHVYQQMHLTFPEKDAIPPDVPKD